MEQEKDKKKKQLISDKYLEDIRNDTVLDQYNLPRECCETVNKTQRYIEDYYQQKRKLRQIELLRDEEVGKLFKYYKTEFEIKLTSSQDVMKFVAQDSKYKKIMNSFYEQECLVEFMDRTIKNLNNKVWMIRNAVELEKMS